MNALVRFREGLQGLISDDVMRPFVCDGSPLDCRVFVVGFNPATTVGNKFWHYWSDENGFDKFHFMEDYRRVKKLRGARPRIEGMVKQLPSNWCLETNICSIPTKHASDVANWNIAIFRYLFEAIKPEYVFLHSNKPIEFFRRATGCEGFEFEPRAAEWQGHCFTLFARPGPLWRMSLHDARALGRRLARQIWEGTEADEPMVDVLPTIAERFAERFSDWRIKLPRRDLEERRAGRIVFEGWWIQYRFGRDEQSEYLDYYAEHRLMWGAEHVRIYATGAHEALPALSPVYPVSNDPNENARLQEEFAAKERPIAAMLKQKGFL